MAGSYDSKVRHFHTKVVGVSHENADGTDRQRVIRGCRLFDLKRLIRDDPELRGMRVKSGCGGKLFALAILLAVGIVVYLVLTGRK